jgi:hypothetical protein
MNKYLLLPTPNYNFCYWVWGTLRFLIRFGEPRDQKGLRSTDLNYTIIKLQKVWGQLNQRAKQLGFLSSSPFYTWRRKHNPASETLQFYNFII